MNESEGTSPARDQIPFLGTRYTSSHRPGATLVNPAWAYVPPVRPGFALNLDREETTIYRGMTLEEVERRRKLEFPIQYPNRYPSRLIEKALVSALARDLRVQPENILLGNGIMNIMTYLYDIYGARTRRVVVPTPGFWPAYTYCFQRGFSIWMPMYLLDNRVAQPPNFTFPEYDTRTALTQDVGLCYLSNPNNPTGTLVPWDAIRRLLTEFPDTMFIVDEAYGSFAANAQDNECFDFDEGVSMVREGCGNLIIARTFSKAYGLASFRVGYIVSDARNIETVVSHMGPYDMSEFSVAMAYYNYQNNAYMKQTVRDVIKNKSLYQRLLENRGVIHYGGFRNSILVASPQLGERYEREGIAVRSMVYQEGIPNPVAHTFRITIPADPDNMEFLLLRTEKIIGQG